MSPESFFATIKTELLHRQPWPTCTGARQAMFEYVEGWYNTRRRLAVALVAQGLGWVELRPEGEGAGKPALSLVE